MTNEARNIILVGIAITALVAGAYYFGTSSKNTVQPVTSTAVQEASSETLATQQTQTTSSPTQKPTTVAETLSGADQNGLACKNFAAKAAATDQVNSGQSTIVLRSHFSQSLNNCYYETFSTFSGGSQTTIKSAPDDDWIAYCADTGSSQLGVYCGMHDVAGRLTQDQFHQLEQQYLTN